jgi:hypothetical protein
MALVTVTALGCARWRGARVDSTPAPFAATDSASYTLAAPYRRAAVRVTFTNATRDTVFLGYCGNRTDAAIEQLQGSEWRRVDQGICPTVLLEPVHLGPGESERFMVLLGPGPGVRESDMIGTMRIVLAVYSVAGSARGATQVNLLPVRMRATAAFVVRR